MTTKNLSPMQARAKRFAELTGIAPDKLVTAVLAGAAKVQVDPDFTAWLEVRAARRKSDKPALNKAQAQKIVKRKFGPRYSCKKKSKYVFCVTFSERLDGGTYGEEVSKGPSWEAAIKAAEAAKEGEK